MHSQSMPPEPALREKYVDLHNNPPPFHKSQESVFGNWQASSLTLAPIVLRHHFSMILPLSYEL
jgi:hypothetical protein